MSTIHRVAIVSSSQPGAMALSVADGFQAIGRDCRVFPFSDWSPALAQGKLRGVGAVNLAFRAVTRPSLQLRLLAEVSRYRPDLILFLKADDLAPWVYPVLRRLTGAKLAAFHPDDPFNQGSLTKPGPSHRRALDQMRLVDDYFIWSPQLVTRCAQLTSARVHYLAFGCDPKLHPRGAARRDDSSPLASDVVFIGNWDKERERWLAPLARSGLDIAIWGSDAWLHRCRDKAITAAWRGRVLLGEEMAVATITSKVCVNLLRLQNKNATNMRTFETPWLGGFMLHEASEGLRDFFVLGQECGGFHTPESLVDAAREYLEDERTREAIRERGAARGVDYTYAGWSRRLIEAVSR